MVEQWDEIQWDRVGWHAVKDVVGWNGGWDGREWDVTESRMGWGGRAVWACPVLLAP